MSGTRNSPTTRRRFDWPELVVVAGLAALASAVATSLLTRRVATGDPPELIDTPEYFQSAYQTKVSRGPEEWIIRDWFNDRRGGVFLDVGAGDYREDSNTFYLETALGWSGLAIDAQADYAIGYQQRPLTKFVPAFVSDRAGDQVRFFVAPTHKVTASASDHFVTSRGLPHDVKQLPTTTLNAILEQAQLTSVDFMNLDIELHEPQALAGFDVERYRPELVCVEAHEPTRDQLLRYFYSHGYRLIGKYLRMDPVNLYFTPEDARR